MQQIIETFLVFSILAATLLEGHLKQGKSPPTFTILVLKRNIFDKI